MKKTLLILLLMFSLFNDKASGDCWTRQVYNNQVIPLPVVQQQPLVVYPGSMVEQVRWVPVVENRVIYRPVISYYSNTSHYYPAPVVYQYQYYDDRWAQYHY